jgi:hypothetical protein
MSSTQRPNTLFDQSLHKLGFTEDDDLLFLVDSSNDTSDPQIRFHLENAKQFNATAIYARKQLNGSYKPQVYLFDFTDRNFNPQNEKEVVEIQRMIWSSGEAPLACVLYNTEVSIIDCTSHIIENVNGDFEPAYLGKTLKLAELANTLYNEQFAIKIKGGLFWEQKELKNKFRFHNNSAYNALIKNIQKVIEILCIKLTNVPSALINKIIVQAILIKYLEERDGSGNKLLSTKYFQKYGNSKTFYDVLKSGHFVELLKDLDHDFNGNVFKWTFDEQTYLKGLDLFLVAELLETKRVDLGSEQLELDFDWRYFEFKFIPVELISRLYETFLSKDRKNKGLYYTPSHLVRLLIDECLPLKNYNDFNLKDFTILDPACGSGIFLVVAFKRLVQIWRLQNGMKYPDIDILKRLLNNLYGVDKEEQAIQLSSFSLSLALCNELKLITIINELQFDDLRENNLVHSDFFDCKEISNKKFSLVIGNPPFIRGSVSQNTWTVENKKIRIPQGQIALKFLSESFANVKENGVVCLIIKSSGLLYNSTSKPYIKVLFSNYNITQIFDFTALARNKSLWDNGADVASAAVFIKNEKPDYSKNILHVTFRRTKATTERIMFEIDDYDLHFVSRQTAINNQFIWKINLLGGGRIKNLVEKAQFLPKLKDVLLENNSIMEEGFEIGSKKDKNPAYIYKIPYLPTNAISDQGINYTSLTEIGKDVKFSKIPRQETFCAPNLIIWEKIGQNRFPVFYNDYSFSFKRRLISIKSLNNDVAYLKSILNSFDKFRVFYEFYLLATSSETLINRNDTFLLKDMRALPFIASNETLFSRSDFNIMNDCVLYQQDFFIHGERSRKALIPIEKSNIKSVILDYGSEFVESLNAIYGNNERKFRLSDVVEFDTSLIATIFRYDSSNNETKFHQGASTLDVNTLTANEISSHLSVNRIIRLYPQKDMIVFVKPNQYRYWISLTAYRDADKYLSKLMDAGY